MQAAKANCKRTIQVQTANRPLQTEQKWSTGKKITIRRRF
jgi:hypothetical protein